VVSRWAGLPMSWSPKGVGRVMASQGNGGPCEGVVASDRRRLACQTNGSANVVGIPPITHLSARNMRAAGFIIPTFTICFPVYQVFNKEREKW
jgi:hypothetical protein